MVESDILDQLATLFAVSPDGMKSAGNFSEFDADAMGRLIPVRAVRQAEDDVGDMQYCIEPTGVMVTLTTSVHTTMRDMVFEREPFRSKDFDRLSKLEMFFALVASGFRPGRSHVRR